MEATLARLKAFTARIDALEAAHKCVHACCIFWACVPCVPACVWCWWLFSVAPLTDPNPTINLSLIHAHPDQKKRRHALRTDHRPYPNNTHPRF